MRRLVDDVVDATNIWLNGQVGAEHLLGARVSYEAEENPLTDLLQGVIKFHIYMTPPGWPRKSCLPWNTISTM